MVHQFLSGLTRSLHKFVLLIPFLIVSDQLFAEQKSLLILGDSLTAGFGLQQEQSWPTLLQHAWENKKIKVINAGISGDTTDGGLARLPRLIKLHQPTHLLIELGGNDGLRGQPIDNMQNNLRKMIELGQKSGVTVILQQMQIPTNMGRRYTSMFMQSYPAIAKEYKIALLPFLLEEVALKPELMQNDRIHPNLKAQPLIAEFMRKNLEPILLD